MPDSIDKLSIDIVSSSESAIEGLRAVTSALKALKSQFSSNGVAENAKNLGNAFRSIGYGKNASQTILQTAKSISKISDSNKRLAQTKSLLDRLSETRPLQYIGNKVGESFRKLKDHAVNLANSFKRIIMYRAIRSIIKSIASGIEEGTKNLYYWSKSLGGEFAQSMDSAATSFLYFKNSIGAAAAPLVNAIVPALRSIINAAVEAVNAINRLFAALSGQSYWTRAIEYTTEYEDALHGAGGAAKELAKYLAPFDELNVLPDDNKGGGGGGSNNLNYKDMFENVDLEPSLFMQRLRTAIEAGDWKGLGATIGNKLNEELENWDSEETGRVIGRKLSSVFQTTSGFVNTTDFELLGEKVAGTINGVLETADWTSVGETIGGSIGGLVGMVAGIVEGTDWSEVWTALSSTITGTFGSFQEKLADIDWANLGYTIIKGIGDFFTETDWAGVISGWLKIMGTSLGAIGALLIGAVAGAWDELKNWWQGFRKQYLDPQTNEAGELTWEGFLNGIKNAVRDIASFLYNNVWIPFRDGFKQGFGISGNSNSKEMERVGEQTIDGFYDGLATGWKAVVDFFEGLVRFNDIIAGNLQASVLAFKRDTMVTFGMLKKDVSEKVSNLQTNVKTFFSMMKTGVVSESNEIYKKASESFKNLESNVRTAVSTLKEGVVSKFNEIRSNVIEKVQNVNSKVKEHFNDITTYFNNTLKNAWESALRNVSGFFDR